MIASEGRGLAISAVADTLAMVCSVSECVCKNVYRAMSALCSPQRNAQPALSCAWPVLQLALWQALALGFRHGDADISMRPDPR